jgi:hypothetical protein
VINFTISLLNIIRKVIPLTIATAAATAIQKAIAIITMAKNNATGKQTKGMTIHHDTLHRSRKI